MTAPPPIKPKAAPPKPAGKPAMPPPPAKGPGNTGPSAPPVKAFSIRPWSGANEGEKIVIYAGSGMGKTTLASTAPKPAFIGVDDGARKIRHPETGEPLMAVPDVNTFEDIRSVLRQPDLFKQADIETVVLDTITKAEELSEPYIFANFKKDDGTTVHTLEGYGWNKGYRHSLEAMRLLLQDAERLIRAGLNVVFLAQESAAVMSNAGGLDWLEAGPKLHHNKQHSTRLEVQEWADHVLRIGYRENNVVGSSKASRGKIATSDTTRVIFASGARHFFAKTRTLAVPVISFDSPGDDSLWRFMFPDKYEGDQA